MRASLATALLTSILVNCAAPKKPPWHLVQPKTPDRSSKNWFHSPLTRVAEKKGAIFFPGRAQNWSRELAPPGRMKGFHLRLNPGLRVAYHGPFVVEISASTRANFFSPGPGQYFDTHLFPRFATRILQVRVFLLARYLYLHSKHGLAKVLQVATERRIHNGSVYNTHAAKYHIL